MECHIHGVVPLLVLFDFTFSSRAVLHRDIYHPMLIGTVYCWWTVLIDGLMADDHTNESAVKPPAIIGVDGADDSLSLYDRYYEFEDQEFILWFLLNLSALCGVHSIAAFLKSKALSTHFVPIRLSSDRTVWIDRNGNIKKNECADSERLKLYQNDKYDDDSKELKNHRWQDHLFLQNSNSQSLVLFNTDNQ